MRGQEWYHAFCQTNQWAWQQYPHYSPRPTHAMPPDKPSWFKRNAEWLLSGALGDWLDRQAMRTTIHFWRKKFRHLDDHTFSVALKSRRYVSKHHPLYFQKKVLEHLAERMQEMNMSHWADLRVRIISIHPALPTPFADFHSAVSRALQPARWFFHPALCAARRWSRLVSLQIVR